MLGSFAAVFGIFGLRTVLRRIPDEIWQKIEQVFVFDDASQDRTTDCVTMVERQIGEWERLMAQHGIEVQKSSVAES